MKIATHFCFVMSLFVNLHRNWCMISHICLIQPQTSIYRCYGYNRIFNSYKDGSRWNSYSSLYAFFIALTYNNCRSNKKRKTFYVFYVTVSQIHTTKLLLLFQAKSILLRYNLSCRFYYHSISCYLIEKLLIDIMIL